MRRRRHRRQGPGQCLYPGSCAGRHRPRRLTGTFGRIGCFSTQTFKHLNSGEGGLLVTDEDDIAAKAILYSGSYMLYGQHGARPPLEVFDRHKRNIPNLSMRMSSLAAAVVRPQLGLLEERARIWNDRYAALADGLAGIEHIHLPPRHAKEEFVASSIQFSLVGMSIGQIERFLEGCDGRGVHIKWFGRAEPLGFTSLYEHWRYIREPQRLPETLGVLGALCDMRIPLSLTREDCRTIAAIIAEVASEAIAEIGETG